MSDKMPKLPNSLKSIRIPPNSLRMTPEFPLLTCHKCRHFWHGIVCALPFLGPSFLVFLVVALCSVPSLCGPPDRPIVRPSDRPTDRPTHRPTDRPTDQPTRDKDTHRPAGRKELAKGRDRTESHNKEYKKRRAQKRDSMSMRDKDTHREKKRMLRIESFALLSKAQLSAPALPSQQTLTCTHNCL